MHSAIRAITSSDYLPCLDCGHAEYLHFHLEGSFCVIGSCECEKLKTDPSQADFDRMNDR